MPSIQIIVLVYMKPNIKIFNLKERTYLTPHYIRITLESDSVSEYEGATLGVNNKLFIAPSGTDKVYLPNDPESENIASHLKAIRRTYTYKGVNVEKREMYVDFVAHGDEGPASNWAINAPVGAELGVAMKLGDAKPLVPEKDTYFLFGDATAIPVLGAILEELKPTARAYVVIEVFSKEDIQTLKTASEAEFKWLINETPGQGSLLAQEGIKHIDTHGTVESFAYIAAEYESVKDLRNYLRKEKNWSKDQFYAYSYWKFGKAETVSEEERREERNRVI